MIDMTPADWIATLGMAGRQAATAARTLANLPPGTNAKDAETAVIASAKAAIVAEMGDKTMPRANVDATQVGNVVKGELDKIIAAPSVLPVTTGATT